MRSALPGRMERDVGALGSTPLAPRGSHSKSRVVHGAADRLEPRWSSRAADSAGGGRLCCFTPDRRGRRCGNRVGRRPTFSVGLWPYRGAPDE